jgi:hypothetical protein
MSPYKSPLILLACALAGTLAACGSSGNSTGSASTPAPPVTSPAPASSAASAPTSAGGSADDSAIAANWTAFFSAKTPVAKRVSLLQDGQAFASVIKSQAGGGLAAAATAKVTKVSITSPQQATVTYSILVGGQPALSGKTGVAVKQDGVWKVGVASFCGLLALENGGKTTGLPSACTSAA